jgi:predicted nucleotidyltransferase
MMQRLTKNRSELLRLFFTNPEQPFYMQEIGRILGKKPGHFQRAINNMEEEGILASEYKANARYFRVNKSYPLYSELKTMIFKTVGITDSVKAALGRIKGIDLAFIYGSYAKSRDNYLSDIDLAVVGKCDEDALIKELDKLEDMLKREINYKLYSPAEFDKDIKYKEPFLLNVLKNKKVIVAGEDALRKILKR